MSDKPTERKLYLKGNCFTCSGKKLGCPYCDRDGQAFVEAADKTLRTWFLSLDDDRRKEISLIFSEESGENE